MTKSNKFRYHFNWADPYLVGIYIHDYFVLESCNLKVLRIKSFLERVCQWGAGYGLNAKPNLLIGTIYESFIHFQIVFIWWTYKKLSCFELFLSYILSFARPSIKLLNLPCSLVLCRLSHSMPSHFQMFWYKGKAITWTCKCIILWNPLSSFYSIIWSLSSQSSDTDIS